MQREKEYLKEPKREFDKKVYIYGLWGISEKILGTNFIIKKQR